MNTLVSSASVANDEEPAPFEGSNLHYCPSQAFCCAIRTYINTQKLSDPLYSLRKFAREVGIDQSLLSKVLRSKRPVTPKLLVLITSRIGLELYNNSSAELARRKHEKNLEQKLPLHKVEIIHNFKPYEEEQWLKIIEVAFHLCGVQIKQQFENSLDGRKKLIIISSTTA